MSGVKTARAYSRLLYGTCEPSCRMSIEKVQGIYMPRLKVEMATDGAGRLVVVMKAGNVAGAKGSG